MVEHFPVCRIDDHHLRKMAQYTTKEVLPPVYAIYSRIGPYKIIMLLKPRSREVVYTPVGIEILSLSRLKLPPYEIAVNIVAKGGLQYVVIPYVKGRSEIEIEHLISQQDIPQEYQIKDITPGVVYSGEYGKIGPVIETLRKVTSRQEYHHLKLNQSPKGSTFYNHFIKVVGDCDFIPGRVVLGKNGDYIISSTLGFDDIFKDLHKCGRSHYLIGVSKDKISSDRLETEETAHSMVLGIETETGILEVFDPNGISPDTRHVYFWTNQLVNFLMQNGIIVQRKITADELFCPQGISAFASDFRGERQCLVWAFWYIWLKENNPGIPGEAIRRYMMRLDADEMFNVIRRIASCAFGR